MARPVDQILQRRRRVVAFGINTLVAQGQQDAARELEGVLLDLDAQLLGLTFNTPQEEHGEVSAGSME